MGVKQPHPLESALSEERSSWQRATKVDFLGAAAARLADSEHVKQRSGVPVPVPISAKTARRGDQATAGFACAARIPSGPGVSSKL